MTDPLYYVSKDHRFGFTADVGNAKIDKTGAPLIAPGHVQPLLRRFRNRYATLVDRTWNELMDQMEVQEQLSDVDVDTPREELIARAELRGKIQGLKLALVHLTQPESTIDAGLAIIDQQATERYDEESA